MSNPLAVGSAGPLAGPAPRDERAALKKLSREFEGVFLAQLFRVMRESVPEGGLATRGSGEEMFSSMLDDRIADIAAQRSEGGLGDALYRQLSRRLPADLAAPAGSETTHDRPGA